MIEKDLLNRVATDKATGFVGRITAVCFYLDGNNLCKLEHLGRNKSVKELWIGEDRVELGGRM